MSSKITQEGTTGLYVIEFNTFEYWLPLFAVLGTQILIFFTTFVRNGCDLLDYMHGPSYFIINITYVALRMIHGKLDLTADIPCFITYILLFLYIVRMSVHVSFRVARNRRDRRLVNLK